MKNISENEKIWEHFFTDFIIKDNKLIKYTGKGGEVVIPDGVTVIKDKAFEGCTDLISVKFPQSVWWIRSHAFYGCTKLTDVTLPNKMLLIEDNAFRNCDNLSKNSKEIIKRCAKRQTTSSVVRGFFDCFNENKQRFLDVDLQVHDLKVHNFCLACIHHNYPQIKKYLKKGLDPNLKVKVTNDNGYYEATPFGLFCAVNPKDTKYNLTKQLFYDYGAYGDAFYHAYVEGYGPGPSLSWNSDRVSVEDIFDYHENCSDYGPLVKG